MKVDAYRSNIYMPACEKLIHIMATSKAQALKFAKQFDGLLIGERIKTYDYEMFNTPDELMDAQAEKLRKGLNEKKFILLDTDLKLK